MNDRFVTLVGAGPGDPDLLTLKAHRAISQATAVVYDRLVSQEIMGLIPADAEKYFAGKSCAQKAMTQEEINQLLVNLAKEGHRVVRLKGGDPYLFGRGGEGALELIKHNIRFEIIPGVSSAQGCSASAGIPLTHRGLATGVRFITGHRMEDGELKLHWQSLADPDTTLVIYMGLKNIAIICEKLIAHGLPATTPAAVIEQGTTSRQRKLLSTLTELPIQLEQAGFQPPSLIIIGKVVLLAGKLNP